MKQQEMKPPPDRRRRFTVALSSVPVEKPNEEDAMELLKSVSILRDLSDEDLKRVIEKCKCQKYEADEPVAIYGASTESLHLVVSGSASISVPQKVGTIKKG